MDPVVCTTCMGKKITHRAVQIVCTECQGNGVTAIDSGSDTETCILKFNEIHFSRVYK